MLKKLFQTNNDAAPLILRVSLAVVMFPHGAQKVLGWFGGYGFSGTMKFFTETAHIPAPFAFLALLAEFAGSIAMTIAVAALMMHVKNGFFMNWNGKVPSAEGFEYHIVVVAIALALMLQGSGKLALDSLIYRKLVRADSPQKTK